MFRARISAKMPPTFRETDVVTGSLIQKSVEFQSSLVSERMSLPIWVEFVSVLGVFRTRGKGVVLPRYVPREGTNPTEYSIEGESSLDVMSVPLTGG
jgi:hypothetical protein